MKKHIAYFLALGLLLMIGCQKELSFETGGTPSEGSLQSDVTGDCLPKSVNGSYVQGTALIPNSNTITITVNVTKTGNYLVYTDTVNGYYFRGSGLFTALGANSVTIHGNGTPFSAGTHNFVVNYDSTICDVQVTVLPAGGGGPATFTLAGSPTNCTGAVINGTYTNGAALTAANTVTVSVNVTAIGTYTISTTPTNGMTFSATGTFGATGVQTVTLAGTGTPTATGNSTIPIAGASSCSFIVPVVAAAGPATGTLGGAPGICTSSTINGVYMIGNPLNTTNTVKVNATVATTGSYNITTTSVTGFSFSATGTFSATGAQVVTLVGTGTPTTVGPQTFTVTWGTSSCTFTITVVPIDYYPRTTNSNWSYENNNDATDSLLRKVIPQTLSAMGNTYNIFMATDDISLGFDSSGYYRKSGGDYFEYFDAGDFIGFDNPLWAEYVMLKDNVAVNVPWNSGSFAGTYMAVPYTFRFKYQVLQKDVPITITTSTGTVIYPNVIVVEEKYEQFVGGVWTDVTSTVGSGKSYYARGVGLIKFEAFNGAGVLQGQSELRRYQVF